MTFLMTLLGTFNIITGAIFGIQAYHTKMDGVDDTHAKVAKAILFGMCASVIAGGLLIILA